MLDTDQIVAAALPHEPGSAPLAPARDASVTFIRDPETVDRLVPRWHRLEERALDPLPTSSADWLVPLMRHTATGDVGLCVAGHGAAAEAVMAIERQRYRWGLPVTVAASWLDSFPISGAPLIDGDRAEQALGALISALPRKLGASALLLRMVPVDGGFTQALEAAARGAGAPSRIIRSWQRAALRVEGTFDAWFDRSFPRKRRKEFRRLKARLGEAGTLECLEHGPGEPLAPWIAEFQALEKSGWKGERGTAVALDPARSAFLAEMLTRFEARGHLRFWKLALDGRPVAMLFAIVSGGRANLGKIAHDEAFARFSPGVLVTLEATKSLFERGSIGLVDSSAAPDHPMIDHLWHDRLGFADVLVGAPGTSLAAFHAMVAAERARRALRQHLKAVYERLVLGVSS